MSSAVQVLSILALVNLRTALARYRSEAREPLDNMAQEARRTIEWLASRQRHWEGQVRRCQEGLAGAEAALRACMASGDRDHPPSCGPYQETVALWRHQLRLAQDELAAAVQHRRQVSQASEAFMQQARRQLALHEQVLTNAIRLLDLQIVALTAYTLTQVFAAPPLVATSPPTGPVLTAHAPPPDPYGAVYEPPLRPPLSPGAVERGILAVRIDAFPTMTDIAGDADFQKVSMADMRAGLERWRAMQPLIESGVGDSGDFWAAVDDERGLSPAQGYRQVYDAFFGDSCIRVESVGGRFDVINGRHRIWLAQQMGIESLPMSVVEIAGKES